MKIPTDTWSDEVSKTYLLPFLPFPCLCDESLNKRMNEHQPFSSGSLSPQSLPLSHFFAPWGLPSFLPSFLPLPLLLLHHNFHLFKSIQKPLMEDKYSMQRQHSGIWRSLRDGDFEEEEIWDVIKENPDYNSGFFKPKESFSSSSAPLPVPRSLSTAARMIPRANNSSSHEANKVVQQSAPVNIPDWSKIYSNNQPKNVSKLDDYSFGQEDNYEGVVSYGGDTDDEEEDEDDGYDLKLPPHEFIARRLARCQISSFSVCEGVGRTLKGRDLSKVRNAVLIKTGFLESL